MDREQFGASAAGRVVRAAEGYWAFVPAPLPPPLNYDGETVLLLSQAEAALSELSGLGRHLPNPHLLITPYVRREAVLSSRIEGTKTNLSELMLGEVDPKALGQDLDDVAEVRNYVRALEKGLRQLKKLPLSLRLVRQIHLELMRGVRGEHATPGEFRRSQNWIGPPGSTPETATFVPPPPTELAGALAEWERFLNKRNELPDLVQCALMHEQFEAIHPFLDGNGRVGRLLITLFLVERGRLSQPLLYLSAFFEARRQEYYDRLQAVRAAGDWTKWIQFFLVGVKEVSLEAVLRAGKLMDLRERLRRRLGDHAKALALLDRLFQNPYVTVARAAKILKTTNPTARQAVNRLVDEGVLQETTGRSWGKVFLARPILRAIEESPMQGRRSERRET
jgi:Fic family protein